MNHLGENTHQNSELSIISVGSDNEPLTLGQLSFAVDMSQMIGVVGNTGAGQSSIVGAPYHSFKGAIIRIKSINWSLNQDSVSVCILLNKNLVYFNVCDERIWHQLEIANLSQYVKHTLAANSALEYTIVEGEKKLSVNQTQFVCFTRAIFK